MEQTAVSIQPVSPIPLVCSLAHIRPAVYRSSDQIWNTALNIALNISLLESAGLLAHA